MRFLIDRKITISMIFVALTFLGYISYKQLQVELIPSTEFPVMFVNISSTKDYDPSYIESEVIIALEGAVAKTKGIESIESHATGRGGNIIVRFKNSVNMKSTSIKFTENINEMAKKLPEEFRVSVHRANTEQNSSQFMTLSIKGEDDMDVDQIRAITETELKTKLENVDGIVSVALYGGKERSINVELQPELCDALGINSQTVSGLISSAGNDRTFTGYAYSTADRHSVFVEGGYDNVALIGDVVVAEGPVFLRDIATITSDLKEPSTISRVDGKRAISVALTGESGANIIELSDRAKAEIDQLNASFAIHGISIVIESSDADEIEENIEQIGILGIIGAFLAIIILWFSLHNLRLVLCIALSIPISVFAAFNIFYALGVTINTLTLIGIALAVGMLLDNSIVVLENIYRLYTKGHSPADAVMKGTRQVWRSIIAATLTTITVFLPFVFTSDVVIAAIGYNLGVAIISTMLFSLFVALLLIPMFTYVILNYGKGRSRFSDKVSIHEKSIQIYTIVLKSVIRKPAIVITSTIVVLLIAFTWALGQDQDENKTIESDRVVVSVKMPPGSTIASSDKTVSLLESKLDSIPERKELRSMVNESSATITLELNEDFDTRGGRGIGEIIDDVSRRLQVNGLEINVASGASGGGSSGGMGQMSGGGMLSSLGIGGDEPNKLALKGSDYQTMIRVADDLRQRLSTFEFIRNASVSVQSAANQIELGFDPITLNQLGISQQQIYEGLMGLRTEHLSGTEIRFGDELIDITITTEKKDTSLQKEESPKNLTDLKQTLIKGSGNALYQLDHIASVRKDKGKGDIKRVDRSRELTVKYVFTEMNGLPESVKQGYETQIDELIADYPMPSGIAVERVEKKDDLAENKLLLLAALILIYMILAAVFESFSTPFVLLFAIPLAAIGSLVALILSGNELLSANTLTGFLILLGVVVNGGIILIDYINILRKRGYSRNRALLAGGASRLRPIMITTLTTIVALLPMALGDSQYAGAIGAPFAITVIGGLLFSSVLTLVLIPTLYMSMENILKWYRGLPTWIHALHLAIFVGMIIYVVVVPNDTLIKVVYILFTVTLVPATTYFIRTSIRIASKNVIPEEEPITITVRNLVKIYDRPGRLKREWMGAKNLRRRLGLDSECNTLSDMKDLLWKSVIAAFCFGMGLVYFENVLWITLMFAIWTMMTISIWNKYWKYYLNKRDGKRPNRFMRLVSKTFNYVMVITALVLFTNSSDGGGITVLYVLLLLTGWMFYRLARRVEKRGINVERINGRFASFRRAMYGAALAMPIIGKKKVPFMALKGVSFTINTGMFGLLGPNGAGKSTFMRIVTGIYEQSYGTVWINDKDTSKYREELQSLIGFLPQEFGTYETMSAWEFLDYQAILKGLTNTKTRAERLEYVLNAVHMFDRKDVKIGSFSGGMKQRIGIALILLNLPRILVVDEPTAGLDPRERIRFRNLLVELSRERIVIFSTHIIEDIASSCNQMAIIDKGELKYYGAPNEMISFARDKVWGFWVTQEEFKALDHSMVVNHMRENEGIRVRYISTGKPTENAQMETPLLEDAYLCLLKNL